jgi:hypothetical protein
MRQDEGTVLVRRALMDLQQVHYPLIRWRIIYSPFFSFPKPYDNQVFFTPNLGIKITHANYSFISYIFTYYMIGGKFEIGFHRVLGKPQGRAYVCATLNNRATIYSSQNTSTCPYFNCL